MTSLHANNPTTTPRTRREPLLTRAGLRAKLQAAQRYYDTLVAAVWGPGYTLLVTPEEYDHHARQELQDAWIALIYWRGKVAEIE